VNRPRQPAAALAAAGVLFLLLATANAAGYRYGVSDQAFHVPSIVRALDRSAFPRDAALIDAQGRLMVFDDAVAWVVQTTGLSLEAVFFAGYLLTAALLWAGVMLVGARLFGSAWATLLLGIILTLRHRIPRTSANSIEPYFYPRTLAFSIGVLAIAAVLSRRHWLPLLLVAAAALVHITTGAWFAVLIAVAMARARLVPYRLALAAAAALAAGLAVAIATGGLQPLLRPIDPAWAAVINTKDSLDPTAWPIWAWAANLGLPALLIAIHQLRRKWKTSTRADEGIVWGALALTLLFLLTLPLVAWGAVLPTQLQISRVFWLVDLVVAVYGVALLADAAARAGTRAPLVAATALLLGISVARGAYVMRVEYPERRLVAVHLPASDWTDAMTWLSRGPRDLHVLAHPGHALLYGSSVRVAAQRDVVLEDAKDTAVALYSRDIAMRVADRRTALGDDFDRLTAEQVSSLADRYGVDVLVTAGRELPFPVAYQNSTFRVYDLR
jgi:hypothetical protein